jgi:outer membrane lipoprotein SlyB
MGQIVGAALAGAALIGFGALYKRFGFWQGSLFIALIIGAIAGLFVGLDQLNAMKTRECANEGKRWNGKECEIIPPWQGGPFLPSKP